MSDTLPTPDPAQQVAEVRQIIHGKTFMHSCESTLLAIRRVVDPPPDERTPVQLTERRWPIMRATDDGNQPPADGVADTSTTT